MAESEDEPSALANFVAAAVGAAATKACVYPMETKATLLALSPGQKITLPLSALFHGVGFALYETAFYNGIVWLFKEKIKVPGQALTFMQAFSATIAARFINYPNENTGAGVRASLRTGGKGPWAVAQAILATSGILGFWQGFHITVLMNGMDAINIYMYEFARRALAFLPEDASIFLAGGLSRVLAIFLFYPIKTLQIRSQVAAAGGDKIPFEMTRSSILKLYTGVQTICVSEGLKVSFRFLIIERLRRFLRNLIDRPARLADESQHKHKNDKDLVEPKLQP